MSIELRWYQREACDKTLEILKADTKQEKHPVVAIPTGGGKSIVICELVNGIITNKPSANILILSHVSDILKQNHAALERYFELNMGLYSAGLKSRTIRKITVAGIQSVWPNREEFQHFDYIIIDECHLVNIEDKGRYRDFIKDLKCNVIGLSASPFRTKGGYLHSAEGSIFNCMAYDLTSMENFNRLVDEGWLSNLIPIPTDQPFDMEGIRTKAGDFHEGDMSKKFDRQSITKAIVEGSIKRAGKKHKKWLYFAIDQEHAKNINKELQRHGIASEVVTSDMEGDKDDIIERYKEGKLKALVSVNMLSTGVDVPDIDMIVMARPTKSPIFHIQSMGRGLRIAPGKTHCLVLDYAGNTARIGPINDIKPNTGKKKKGGGGSMIKTCGNCSTMNHLSAKECIGCGEKFHIVEKISKVSSSKEVIKKTPKKGGIGIGKQWVKVTGVSYSIHQKAGSPNSLKVTYKAGLNTFVEYICLQHKGYPRIRAKSWVENRWRGSYSNFPKTVQDLYRNKANIAVPSEIYVDTSNKYPNIEDTRF